MATIVNVTESGQLQNLTALSGAEALSVNAVDVLNQIVSAGTEEEAAMGAFKDSQLQALVLRCDQSAVIQFLGLRYPILATAIVPPDTVTHTGDITDMIFQGDLIRLEGTVGDDGVYLVEVVAFAAGVTTITLASGQGLPAGGGGAVGTLARIASKQLFPVAYAAITVTAATGTITFTGDLSDKFAAGEFIIIDDSTGNDGYWEIQSVVFAAPTTTIVLTTVLPNNTNDGNFAKCRAGFELGANQVVVWRIEGGTNNPFQHPAPVDYNADRGDVDACMVTVPGVTNGQFDGLVAKNPELP